MQDNSTAATEYPALQTWPGPVRVFGQVVSFLFHPLFIPSYITAYLLYADPYAFAGMSEKGKILKLISVAFSTSFLPLFSVALMKQLGFVTSIYLKTQKDRIIPYIVSMIFYFWAWYVSKNLHDSGQLVAMLLAVFLSCIAGMMANIYYKISMHGIAVGALFVLFLWMASSGNAAGGTWLAIATLVTGLVCTARLIVSDHTSFEVYSGLMVGALCQLVAIAVAG
ncbi:MAG TPA: hypothetical protein VL307_03650 [Chitinophagaceae bacterium]|nr:hypothetical protein [Chitinophagaceae bacterium]